jgi:3-oxoacyl-(acyl-carrier-protein) synthase
MKVYVAGLGVVSPLGIGVPDNLNSLRSKQHGIHSLSQELDPCLPGFPIARVNASNNDIASKLGVNPFMPRTALLSLLAASEAVEKTGIDIKKHRSGFFSATTVGGMDLTEQFFKSYIKNENHGQLRQVVNHECGKVTDLVAGILGVNSYVTTINTACSSSANSIMLATRLIKEGRLDVAIAGGADALTAYTLNGFNTLLLLDDELCKPFDAKRKGLNLGEGAGYVVLVSEELVSKYKCNTLCHVNGYANKSDAFHQTALSANGEGPYLAMSGAIKMSGLSVDKIDYINLHGTATPNNDSSEANAIKRIFEDNTPAVSSTKSYTGHTLGASGGIEAVYSILALSNNVVFPNLRFSEAMPEIPLTPAQDVLSREINNVMSNSFGFGGNCSSLLFSKQ